MVANLLNSMSMMCSGITLTYVVKSLIPFFTVLCCRFRGQHFGLEIYASLLPICMGVSLASATDVDCSLIGLLCALGSSLAQTLLNITSKERIESLKLSGMEAFTVMATICAGLSVPLLWLSYSQDTGNGILSAILSPTDGMPLLALQIVSMAAFAYHVEYTLNFLFVALCTPLAFSVTDIVRRLGTICCGAILFSKPMTMLNVLGVVVSLTGVAAYTTVSKRAAARARSESKEWSAQYSALRDGGSEDREKQPDLNRMGDSSISLGFSFSSLSTPKSSTDNLQIGKNVLQAMQLRRQLSVPVPTCTLRWQDLEVAYRTAHGRRITLHKQSGSVQGGNMLAIMGASGAGKSTLLDTLTMRKTLGDVSGRVFMNGREQDEGFFFASAYVAQEDNLIPTNTVRETVEFYAELTMPRYTPPVMRKRAISERLQAVGLADKEAKFVGGKLPGGFSIRGLSGGERRRLNIAAGVVHSPPLVFLDEPTSGLDAFSALCVMESIRALTRAGHAVACTIHQPRQAIVDMFDKVLFLACGHLVYNGPPSGLKKWLTESNLWDPERAMTTSITDMVLDCITVGFEKSESIYGSRTLRDQEDVERLAEAYLNSISGRAITPDATPKSFVVLNSRPGVLHQYWTLQRQQLRSSLRSPGTLAARIGLHFLIGLLMGSVYFQMNRSYIQPPDGIWLLLPLPLQRHSSMPEDRVGVLFLLALAQTVTPNCAMPFFIDDRQYYTKEAAARLYGALPYHLANVVSEAVVCAVNGVLASGIATLMAGLPLSGNWYSTMSFLVSHHMCASALVQMCARLAPNQDVAFVLSAGYIIVCMLFANVVVKVATVTPLLAWMRWCTFLYFSMAGLIEAEFAGTKEQDFPAGDRVVDTFRIRWGDGEDAHILSEGDCFKCLWSFYLFFSMVGFFALKFGSKSQI
ncbi:abcG22 [Symbiodinium sp. KB8]|nr:abcG22 [Symbiodinium sp. KB8]